MKKIGYALILAVSVPVLVYVSVFMVPTLYYSDFDKFAKATIREFGNRWSDPRPTKALLGYLRERRIENPAAFRRENADFLRKNADVFSRGDPRSPTEALLGYLRERRIEDPIAFLRANADVSARKEHIDDPGLSVTDGKYLRNHHAISFQAFTKKFPTFPIGESELRIVVYDKRGGGIELVAYVILRSL